MSPSRRKGLPRSAKQCVMDRRKTLSARPPAARVKAIDPALGDRQKLGFSEHHYSHAASAYYPSPFTSALVLTMDGVGEWATTSLALGQGDDLNIIKEIRFPHSLACFIRPSPITPASR
ncbi:MAG: carbamoyltransferase N-terminal domain-containing protein [Methylovirgula sp.]